MSSDFRDPHIMAQERYDDYLRCLNLERPLMEVMMEVPNTQLVGTQGELVGVLAPRSLMTKEEALVHAAWLVAVADPLDEHFPEVLKAVKNT